MDESVHKFKLHLVPYLQIDLYLQINRGAKGIRTKFTRAVWTTVGDAGIMKMERDKRDEKRE